MSGYVERANSLEPSVLHAELRAEADTSGCPVHWVRDHDPPFAVLSRHSDVLAALRAPATWGNGDGPGVFVQRGGVLGSADDPDHRRQRTVLNDDFRPARIERLRPALERFLDELWAPFRVAGEGDVVPLLAFPFPALAIAELLGVDPGDRERFGRWADAIVAALGGGDLGAYQAATDAVWAYVDRLVDARGALLDAGEPLPDDVLSTMTCAMHEGRLSRGEVRRLGHQLLVAGHETTASLIAAMFHRLAERPHLLAQLQADPALVDVAVEELLRHDAPVQGLFRTNREPVALAGERLPAGTKLQLLYASANHDGDVWEDADEIRFDRDPRTIRTHLAFGWGVHHCIGAALARLEGRLVLARIVHGIATLEPNGAPVPSEPFILRGMRSLPMRWTPRA